MLSIVSFFKPTIIADFFIFTAHFYNHFCGDVTEKDPTDDDADGEGNGLACVLCEMMLDGKETGAVTCREKSDDAHRSIPHICHLFSNLFYQHTKNKMVIQKKYT